MPGDQHRFCVEQAQQLTVGQVKEHLGEVPDAVALDFGGATQNVRTVRHPGRRAYFACPACGRQVGSLYLSPGGSEFACRACAGLVYLRQLTGRNAELREAVRERSKAEHAQRPDLEQASDALELCASVDRLLGREDHRLLADLARVTAEAGRSGPG